ncbi:hypothetical protein GCM10018785_38850 [Streptomyces longispororuber]|uniref:Uncharacterized protein n=1 Tax=Streptomyces longispororuber TaxID=68230 RepID=A0A918ZRF7_9ACTN|nr:hypothetical protein GCM10018785_38850 [Streptomyces longispororuber]
MAAAQAARDDLLEGLGTAIESGEDGAWLDWLDGVEYPGDDAGPQSAADALAADNDSQLQSLWREQVDGYLGYRVRIRTNYTVGDSIIPGTETQHATAEATAVIAPRCDVAPADDPEESVEFSCNGEPFEIDPEDFDMDDLPDASDMFAVHLAK